MEVQLGLYTLTIADDFGPRILGLVFDGGPNLFAELGDLSLDHPAGPFRFAGGHRLWAAPEVVATTYWPDDGACSIEVAESVTVVGPSGGPFEKWVTISHAGGQLLVSHRLTNQSGGPIEVAPWAITQLPVGGTALLPIGGHGDGVFQAAKTMIGWPYTDFGDPGIDTAGSVARIDGTRASATKVGVMLADRPLAYERDGWLFAKRTPYVDGPFVDLGATGQVYVNADFVELETLGPLTILGPGDSISHDESWIACEVDGNAVDLDTVFP